MYELTVSSANNNSNISFRFYLSKAFSLLTRIVFGVALFLLVVTVSADHFVELYETNRSIRASIPSIGLFQIANFMFWSVIFFSFSEKLFQD